MGTTAWWRVCARPPNLLQGQASSGEAAKTSAGGALAIREKLILQILLLQPLPTCVSANTCKAAVSFFLCISYDQNSQYFGYTSSVGNLVIGTFSQCFHRLCIDEHLCVPADSGETHTLRFLPSYPCTSNWLRTMASLSIRNCNARSN